MVSTVFPPLWGLFQATLSETDQNHLYLTIMSFSVSVDTTKLSGNKKLKIILEHALKSIF